MPEDKKVFGTDGVRGRANHFPMTVEMAVALGRAAGKVFRRQNTRSRVVIGKDTRLSCYMYENALISGLCSMGIDTLMVGPFPTPGVAFITRAYRADAGIVISASHNPFYDNGIKFFSSEGFKFSDSWEKEMEALVELNDFRDCLPKDYEIGRNTKVSDANGRYIEFAKATFPRKHTLRGMKIALDCANGAAYKIAPLIFQELDAEVHTFGCEPNGLNINNGVGALFPQEIQKGVIHFKADVGIALDGDGDRIIMVDEHAQIVDGDTLLAICAKDMQKKGILKNSKVVSTVMCNFGFIQAMKSVGVEVIQTAVGDRYVIQGMLEHDCNLGGEQSGHTIFLDHNTTGDALVTALQVLRIMIETDSSLSELATFVQKCPQVTLNVQVKEKKPFEQMEAVQKEIKAVEQELKDSGRVLVRYSGTENICRVMVEGQNQKQISSYAKRIADQLKKEIGQ